MSETPTTQAPPAHSATPAASGWVGWVVFAAGLLVVVGLFNVIVGLAALLRGPALIAGAGGALLWAVLVHGSEVTDSR